MFFLLKLRGVFLRFVPNVVVLGKGSSLSSFPSIVYGF